MSSPEYQLTFRLFKLPDKRDEMRLNDFMLSYLGNNLLYHPLSAAYVIREPQTLKIILKEPFHRSILTLSI